MSAIFTPDTVEDSSLDLQQTIGSKIRGGLVEGISGDPSSALEDCLEADGFPAMGSVIKAGKLSLQLTRVQVKPISGDTARVLLFYQNDGGFTPSAYTITCRAYLQGYETNLVAGTGEQILLKYVDPNDPGNVQKSYSVGHTIALPMREVTVEGLAYGEPDVEKFEGFIGNVNKEEWRGLRPGYWLISDGGVDLSRYTGWYRFHLSALTRNFMDWSEQRDLLYPRIGGAFPIKPEDIQRVAALPYKQGIIAQVNGRTRWGDYPMVSFEPIFGFSDLTWSGTPIGTNSNL